MPKPVMASGDIQLSPAAPTILTANGLGKGAPAGLAIWVKPSGEQLDESLALFVTSARRITNPIDARVHPRSVSFDIAMLSPGIYFSQISPRIGLAVLILLSPYSY